MVGRHSVQSQHGNEEHEKRLKKEGLSGNKRETENVGLEVESCVSASGLRSR